VFWPKFNELLVRGLTPDRVWTEIITRIKGSLRAAVAGRCLNQNEYTSLIQANLKRKLRGATTHDLQDAERIYKLFQSYEHLKRPGTLTREGYWDTEDLALHLNRQWSQGKPDNWPTVNRIFVDEVSPRPCWRV
jgi:hypothetical protein